MAAGLVPVRREGLTPVPLVYPDAPIPLPTSTPSSRVYTLESWSDSVDAAREHASARPRRPRDAAAQAPAWALNPPREVQHPRVTTWREECELRGLTPLSAPEERSGGLGTRNAPPDPRPLISPSHPDITAAHAHGLDGERPSPAWHGRSRAGPMLALSNGSAAAQTQRRSARCARDTHLSPVGSCLPSASADQAATATRRAATHRRTPSGYAALSANCYCSE